MKNVLLFGGTAESHEIIRFLLGSGCRVTVSVASGYAGGLIEPDGAVTVSVGRLTADGMAGLMKEGGFDLVIDATHPYAVEATANIKAAAEKADVPRLRLLRGESETKDFICCKSIEEAVRLLSKTEGAVLIATGSKELEKYAALPDFAKRCYARVLPVPEALQKCAELGLPKERVIAMQGPFSEEENIRQLRRLEIALMVTKDGGAAGGFPEKAQASRQCGTKLIVISRPGDSGLSMEELKQEVIKQLGL